MEDLFYSELEKTYFWVAGYCLDLNTSNVVEKTKSLLDNAKIFAFTVSAPIESVKTFEIFESRSYKNMRVFYIENQNEEDLPKRVFRLRASNNWTMQKWIQHS